MDLFCAGSVMRAVFNELTLSVQLSSSPFVPNVKLETVACLELLGKAVTVNHDLTAQRSQSKNAAMIKDEPRCTCS